MLNTATKPLFAAIPTVNEATATRRNVSRVETEHGLATSRALFPLLHGLPMVPNPAHPAYVPAQGDVPAHIDQDHPDAPPVEAGIGWGGRPDQAGFDRAVARAFAARTGGRVPAFIPTPRPRGYAWSWYGGEKPVNTPCRCGDVGYLLSNPTNAPYSDAPLPRAYCSCPAGRDMRAAAIAAYGWEYSGAAGPGAEAVGARALLPIRGLSSARFLAIRDSALAAYIPRTDEQRAALRVIRTVVAGGAAAQGRTGVLLYGPTGTGKTHLAVATLRAMRDAHPTASVRALHIEELTRLLDTIHFRLNDYTVQERHAFRAELDAIEATDTLLIDDLGTESITGPVREDLIAVLERRFLSPGRRTIITTNVDPTSPRFAELYGDRCLSRARPALALEAVGGTDLRAEGAPW